MKYIKDGDLVRIKDMPLSIHNNRVRGKVGIVIGCTDTGKRYKDEQLIVSIPSYKILWLLPMYLEKVNEER